MHQVIRVLVSAKDETEALDTARRVVQEHLVGRNDPNVWSPPYDSAVDFAGKGMGIGLHSEMAVISMFANDGIKVEGYPGDAEGRWGKIPAVAQVSTPDFPCESSVGMEQVKVAMDSTLTEFKSYMTDVRDYVTNYTDEQLFAGEFEGQKYEFQRRLNWAAYGGDVWLYFGEIDDCGDYKGSHVDRVLFLWQLKDILEPRHRIFEHPLWVVPFDVHM